MPAVDVAVVGAGPYGLSLAAHLRAAGTPHRVFGLPMHGWESAMPAGMYLKSQGFASNLSDPARTSTLEAFCRQTGRAYAPHGRPVPLADFVAYGRWFQRSHVPDLEEITVDRLEQAGRGFVLTLTGGEEVPARAVVVAAGIGHFAYLPPVLAALPASACTHSGAHADLSVFAGQDVLVVGAGQSALESAALLQEQGATVRVVAREPTLAWNGPPLPPERPLLARLREPEAGLGSGWATWFYSCRPHLFRHLPARQRVRIARTALGPAGAAWLRERVEGRVPVVLGTAVEAAEVRDGQVALRLVPSSAATRAGAGAATRPGAAGPAELVTGHVVAATGYRTRIARLPFLPDTLRATVRTVGGAPVVDHGFQSSVPGLFFAGPAVAGTFGPVMRFVYGTDFAARVLARRLAGGAAVARSAPPPVRVR